jgi:excisionase family DNA binding protein
MSDRMLTYEDLSDRWQVSVQTLREWVMKKKLKPVKLGRLVRFPESYIREIEANKGLANCAYKEMA